MTWHAKKYEETLKHFEVEPRKGLTTDKVQQMRDRYGSNDLLTKKPKPSNMIAVLKFCLQGIL